MKAIFKKVLSLTMAIVMVLQIVAPAAVLAVDAGDMEKHLSFTRYERDDGSYFEYVPEEDAALIEERFKDRADDKIQVKLTTYDVENIKLILRKDYTLFDDTTYESRDEAQEAFDRIKGLFEEQGLAIAAKIVEVPEEDGTVSYKIKNNVDIDVFMEENDLDEDFKANYDVYFLEVDDQLEGVYLDEETSEEPEEYNFVLTENPAAEIEDETATDDIFAAIVNIEYYTTYAAGELAEEREVDQKVEEETPDSTTSEKTDAVDERDRATETKIETEPVEGEEISAEEKIEKALAETAKRDAPQAMDALEISEEQIPEAVRANEIPPIVDGKNFQLKTELQLQASRTLPIPRGWYVDVYLGNYLKPGAYPIADLKDGSTTLATGEFIAAEHKIRYTFTNPIYRSMSVDIDQLLEFDAEAIVKDLGADPDEMTIQIGVKPKNLSLQQNSPIILRRDDPRQTITSQFVVGGNENINSVTYPYKLEVSSSQKAKLNGQDIVSVPSLLPDGVEVWWDFTVDTSPLRGNELNFENLNISLFASNQQGLKWFDYKIATDPQALEDTTGYRRSGTTGPELLTADRSIAKSALGDKLYIRVKAPLKTYRAIYSMGLRINPDRNYVQSIVDDFVEQFNRLPFIFKFMRGVEEARQIARTPFNLVDGMYTAEIGLPSENLENFYYDSSRIIVANRATDTVNEWFALDLLRLGESEDSSLERAVTTPSAPNIQKMYFVPKIDGGYYRYATDTNAKLPDGSFKPGVIVSYKYYSQRGKKETNYKFSATLSEKKQDFVAQVEGAQNAPTQGGPISLFTRRNTQSLEGDGYLAYTEHPYSLMRINKTFEMAECFNANRESPSLSQQPDGIYLDRHVEPTGDYLITRLSEGSALPGKLQPGAALNPHNLSQGKAMEDLMKRVYFYAEREKEAYADTHGGAVMHRYIEAGMRQKVLHYFTDGKSLQQDYYNEFAGLNENNPSWLQNIILTGGYKPGTSVYNLEVSFIGEKGVNTYQPPHPWQGLRKLSPGERPLGLYPLVRNEQIKYADNVLRNVLASYENDEWEKQNKADSVRLVFYSHTSDLQELLTAHVTKPITINKENDRGEKIPGAEFRLVNKKTGEVSLWTSSADVRQNLKYLKEGSYYVEETKAPSGYDILPAFTLNVHREEINPDDGPFGAYKVLKETGIHVNDGFRTEITLGDDVPKGADGRDLVKLSDDKLSVQISDPQSNLGEIKFEKKTEENKDKTGTLDGAEFTLTKVKSKTDLTPERKVDGTSVYKKTSKGYYGKFEFKQMPVGIYLLEETKVPSGYKKAPNRLIEVVEPQIGDKLIARFLDEEIQSSKVILNETIKRNVPFKKVGEDAEGNGAEALSGAKFRLYSIDTIGDAVYDETIFSDENGNFEFKDLIKGEYILTELVAPRGYQTPQTLEDENQRFFGWKLIVDQVEGEEKLSYKLYKLKTEQDVQKPAGELTEIDLDQDGLITIENKIRQTDVAFQKYIENPDFNETIPESETNKKYIPIDTGLLTREDGQKVAFDLYRSDFYGAKVDNDPTTPEVDPIVANITSDEQGIFHLNGLKFNGYYILEETVPPDGYQKANPIVLRVQQESALQGGDLKVIVRDLNINTLLKNGNVFAGVIDFSENKRPGKFSIKKTGNSLDPNHPGEVGLRRAYFRLYFADEQFNKKKNEEGYDDYIQKVTQGVPLTDQNGNPIDATTLPPDQGIVTFDQLEPGNYILEEFRGPAGYEKNPAPWYIQVKQDGTVIKSRSKDDPNFLIQGLNFRTFSDSASAKTVRDMIQNPAHPIESPSEQLAKILPQGVRAAVNDLATIGVTGSEVDAINGTRGINVQVVPKSDILPPEPKKLHMVLMLDRSRHDREGEIDGTGVDNNINKFLNDLNDKANANKADVDISLIEYAGGYSKYVGTFNLNTMNANPNLDTFKYYEAWYYDSGSGGGLAVSKNPETLNNYLKLMGVREITGTSDGSDVLKRNLGSYLSSIDGATSGKTYDAKLAVNFAKSKIESLKKTGEEYDIIANMETMENKGYDTWTYHADLRQLNTGTLPSLVNRYRIAIDNFKKQGDGTNRFYEFRKADRFYQEETANQTPYVQKAMAGEILKRSDYFGTGSNRLVSRVKDATFNIALNSPVVADGGRWEIGKYRGNQRLEDPVNVTKTDNNLQITNLDLETDEHLKVSYTAKLNTFATYHYQIHGNIGLTVGGDTQTEPNGLEIWREQNAGAVGIGKGNGEIKVNFSYSNYPADQPEGKAGSIKLQANVNGEWRNVALYDVATGSLGQPIKSDAPFSGTVNFTGLDTEPEYRIVYTRNAPYYKDWGEAEVSYYKVEFGQRTSYYAAEVGAEEAIIEISNGNLLKIFNEDENGFRIPLRVTKIDDDKAALAGSRFRARKIINGEAVVNSEPVKYAEDAFDAVSEATGLVGDNYFRELTPGIYELWEEQAPEGYKKLNDRWYFQVKVDPDKKPSDPDYMQIDFQFKYTFPANIEDEAYNDGFREWFNLHATAEEKARILGQTVYGLDYANKEDLDPNATPEDYGKFIQNIEIVEDDGRSHPARPDAPYQTIDDAQVTNHRGSGELQFNKVNENSKSIDGAEFKLTKVKTDSAGNPVMENGKPAPEVVEGTSQNAFVRYATSSIATGVHFEGMLEGTYILEEIEAAKGYKKIDGYLLIRYTENERGELIQTVDLEGSTQAFAELASLSDQSLVSVKNTSDFINFEFTKKNTKGDDVLASAFLLEEVDENGAYVPNGYKRSLSNFSGAKYTFYDLREGRYKLTETNATTYETPAPWYFNVTRGEDGQLTIVFEKDDDSVREENGQLSIVNYEKIGYRFKKVERGSGDPLSNIYFDLRKVRTDATENGVQLYDAEGKLADEALEPYVYEKRVRSDRDGGVYFDNLTEGVYELAEDAQTKPEHIKQNTQDRWILKVVKEGDALQVVYDKQYEANYFKEHDPSYYETEYVPRGYANGDLFGKEDDGTWKLENLVDGTSLRWKKVDANYGVTIPREATFNVYKIGDDPNDLTNSKIFATTFDPADDLSDSIIAYNGTYEIQGLNAGLYKIAETKAPEGYVGAERSFLAQIKEDEAGELQVNYYEIGDNTVIGDPYEYRYIDVRDGEVVFDADGFVGIENEPTSTSGIIEIDKKDHNGKPLEGARFTLYNEKGEIVKEALSGKDGKIALIDIKPGSYTLIESKAPLGYDVSTEKWSVYVATDGKTYLQKIGQSVPSGGQQEGQNVSSEISFNKLQSHIRFVDGVRENGRLDMDTAEDNIAIEMQLQIAGTVDPGDYFVIKESDTLHYNMLQPDKPNYPDIVDADGNVLARWAYGRDFDMEKGTGKDIYYTFTDAVRGKNNLSMHLTWGHSVNRNIASKSGSYRFSVTIGSNEIFNNLEIVYPLYAKEGALNIGANYLYTDDRSGRYTQIAYINPNRETIDGDSTIIWVYPDVDAEKFNRADITQEKTKVSLYRLNLKPTDPVPQTVVFDESKMQLVDPSAYRLDFAGKYHKGNLVNAARIVLNEPVGDAVYLVKIDSEMDKPTSETDLQKETYLGQYVELENSLSKPAVKKGNVIATNFSGATGDGEDNYIPPKLEVVNRPHVDKNGRFELNKVDELGANLSGATFTLTPVNPTGDAIERITEANGKIAFDSLKPGTYKLEETKAPTGYRKIDTTWTVTVDENGVTKVTENANVASRMNLFKESAFGKLGIAGGNFSSVGAPRSATPFNESISGTLSGASFGDGGTKVSTKATALGGGKYKIDLDITGGQPKSAVKPTDVVVVLPAHMGSNLETEYFKAAVANWLNALGQNADNQKAYRIAYVTYGYGQVLDSGGFDTIANRAEAIRNLGVEAAKGTTISGMDKAFERARDIFANDPRDADRILLNLSMEMDTIVKREQAGIQSALQAIPTGETSEKRIYSFVATMAPATLEQQIEEAHQTALQGNGWLLSTNQWSRGYTAAQYQTMLPAPATVWRSDVDGATLDIAFNGDFNYAGDLESSTSISGTSGWANLKSGNAGIIAHDLTLQENETAHVSFILLAREDIQEGSYPLLGSIKLSPNADPNGISSPILTLEKAIEMINLTLQSVHNNTRGARAMTMIQGTFKRKLYGVEDSSFEKTVEIPLGATDTIQVEKTDASGQAYDYYLASVSSTDEKITVTRPTNHVSGVDGIFTVYSQPRENFSVAVDWNELVPDGNITMTLSTGYTITLSANQSSYTTDALDPETVTIESVAIDNDAYQVSLVGDKSPYRIEVSEKMQFVVQLDWGNLTPKGNVTATLSDGTTLTLDATKPSHTFDNIDSSIKIQSVAIDQDDYDAALITDRLPYIVKITKTTEIPSIDVENQKAPRGQFDIKKVDEEQLTTVLENAVFLLSRDDAEKTEVKREISNAEGIVHFGDLAEGNYILEEIQAPEGYMKTDTKWKVAVDAEGKVTIRAEGADGTLDEVVLQDGSFTVGNRTKPKAEIALHKTDGLNGEALQDVAFQLSKVDEQNQPVTGSEAKIVTGTTDEAGKLVFKDIAEGRYKLEETTSIFGYYDILVDFIVVVDAEGGVTYTRTPKKPSSPELAKSNSTKDLSYSVEFLPKSEQVPDYAVSLKSDSTGENVLGTLENQAEGTFTPTPQTYRNYYATLEWKDPAAEAWDISYIRTANNQVRIIAYKKDAYEQLLADGAIEIRNFPEQEGETQLNVVKTDGDTKAPIKGVVFNIQGSNGYNKNFTTDENGKIVVDKIPNGVYDIVEISAPAGYIVDKTPRQVIVGGNYKVPEKVTDPRDVTEKVHFEGDTEIHASNPQGDAQTPIVVKTNDSEGFNIASKYKFDEGIKPGDYFYLDVSRNANTWGIYPPEHAYELNLVGSLGLLARGEFVKNENGHYGIKYTFTDYIDSQYPETASSKVSYFTEEDVVKDDGVITFYTALNGDEKSHQVEVVYTPTTYWGFTGGGVNSVSRLVEVDWDLGTYRTIIYVNRYQYALSGAVLDFGHDPINGGTDALIRISDEDSVKVYRKNEQVDLENAMPKSFGLEEAIDKGWLEDQTDAYNRNGSIYIQNNRWNVNFGDDMIDQDAYVVVIDGHFDGSDRSKRLWFRQNLEGAYWNDYDYAWYADTATNATFNDPYENRSSSEGNITLGITNGVNEVRYLKMNEHGRSLQGAVFELRKRNGQGDYERVKEQITTEADGVVRWTDLYAGEYQIWEMKAPEGYESVGKDGKLVKTFTVNENKTVVKSEATDPNTRSHAVGNSADIIVNKKLVDFEILKRDFADDTPLEGAVFSLYKQIAGFDDDSIRFNEGDTEHFAKIAIGETSEWTTNADGKIVFNGLEDGTYYVKEVRAPAGYANIPRSIGPVKIEDGAIAVPDPAPTKAEHQYDLSSNTDATSGKITNTVTVYDRKSVYPDTGGMGPLFIVLAGVLMMGASTALYKKRYAKH